MRPALIPTDLYLPLGVHKGDLGTFVERLYRDRAELIDDIVSGQIDPWQVEHGIARLIPGPTAFAGLVEDVTLEIAQVVWDAIRVMAPQDRERHEQQADWALGFLEPRFWEAAE